MNAESPVKEITIAGHSFPVAQPYAAGHAVTEAEARALNQVRAENIRNNMASRVKIAMGEEPTDEVNPDTIASIVAQYDAEYEFTLASVGGGRRSTDPNEVEATRIARSLLADWAKSNGLTVKSLRERLGDDAYAEKVAEIAARDAVIKEAKRRVKQRAEQAANASLDLGLDDIAPAEQAAE